MSLGRFGENKYKLPMFRFSSIFLIIQMVAASPNFIESEPMRGRIGFCLFTAARYHLAVLALYNFNPQILITLWCIILQTQDFIITVTTSIIFLLMNCILLSTRLLPWATTQISYFLDQQCPTELSARVAILYL